MSWLAQLQPWQTQDEAVLGLVREVGEVLMRSPSVMRLDGLDVVIVDFERIPAELKQHVFTVNCIALVEESVVVVNQAFLIEIETAIRAFGLAGSVLATPFLQSDASMYGWLRCTQRMGARYLGRLRRMTDGDPSVRRALVMGTVFFLAHEIGHLLAGHDGRRFGSFVDATAPLEAELATATLKYSRHLDDLESYGFSLSLSQSDTMVTAEMRAEANEVLGRLPEHDRWNTEHWFADERLADQTATTIVLECLAAIDPNEAAPSWTAMVRGLFAAAVASWHGDLLTFQNKLGVDVRAHAGAATLVTSMMQDRTAYVGASVLFGEIHRFTLLRAVLAIGEVARAHADHFAAPEAERTIWYTGPDRRVHAEADALQRWMLLRILMDTAVKLATVGAATPWILQKDAERGTPQLFMMNFEPLQAELKRLTRMK